MRLHRTSLAGPSLHRNWGFIVKIPGNHQAKWDTTSQLATFDGGSSGDTTEWTNQLQLKNKHWSLKNWEGQPLWSEKVGLNQETTWGFQDLCVGFGSGDSIQETVEYCPTNLAHGHFGGTGKKVDITDISLTKIQIAGYHPPAVPLVHPPAGWRLKQRL